MADSTYISDWQEFIFFLLWLHLKNKEMHLHLTRLRIKIWIYHLEIHFYIGFSDKNCKDQKLSMYGFPSNW